MRRYRFWFLQPLVFVALFFLGSIALFPTNEKIDGAAMGPDTGARWYDWAALAVIVADVLLFVVFWVLNRRANWRAYP